MPETIREEKRKKLSKQILMRKCIGNFENIFPPKRKRKKKNFQNIY